MDRSGKKLRCICILQPGILFAGETRYFVRLPTAQVTSFSRWKIRFYRVYKGRSINCADPYRSGEFFDHFWRYWFRVIAFKNRRHVTRFLSMKFRKNPLPFRYNCFRVAAKFLYGFLDEIILKIIITLSPNSREVNLDEHSLFHV